MSSEALAKEDRREKASGPKRVRRSLSTAKAKTDWRSSNSPEYNRQIVGRHRHNLVQREAGFLGQWHYFSLEAAHTPARIARAQIVVE
jgi:hypothetical protein